MKFVGRIHRNTVCDTGSFMYGVKHHSLDFDILEDRGTLVIAISVQNHLAWLPSRWYGEVGSDVRDCVYRVYKLHRASHHTWAKAPSVTWSPGGYQAVSEICYEVSIYSCLVRSRYAGCLEISINNSWYLVCIYMSEHWSPNTHAMKQLKFVMDVIYRYSERGLSEEIIV